MPSKLCITTNLLMIKKLVCSRVIVEWEGLSGDAITDVLTWQDANDREGQSNTMDGLGMQKMEQWLWYVVVNGAWDALEVGSIKRA